MGALRRRYGGGKSLWTIDYRAIWPDGRGLWRIAIVRALTAADAVAALRRVERGVALAHVRVTAGHDVPGYESRRIIDARSIL